MLKKVQYLYTVNSKEVLHKLHWEEKLSIRAIAKKYNVSSYTMFNIFKHHDIPIKNKSQAQKDALEKGAKHPTKGKIRSVDTKTKIADGVKSWWDNRTEKERDEYSQLKKNIGEN